MVGRPRDSYFRSLSTSLLLTTAAPPFLDFRLGLSLRRGQGAGGNLQFVPRSDKAQQKGKRRGEVAQGT